MRSKPHCTWPKAKLSSKKKTTTKKKQKKLVFLLHCVLFFHRNLTLTLRQMVTRLMNCCQCVFVKLSSPRGHLVSAGNTSCHLTSSNGGQYSDPLCLWCGLVMDHITTLCKQPSCHVLLIVTLTAGHRHDNKEHGCGCSACSPWEETYFDYG